MRNKNTYITILTLLILALPFIFHPYVVSGGSMEPAYHEGEVVLTESFTPQIHVWRGEVFVIHNPHDRSVIDIKRVVGLPNEDVTAGENNVTAVNRSGLARTFGAPIGQPDTGFFEMHLGPADYMVLGDNRSKSTDSRNFGAVQAGDIIGHVIVSL